MSLINAIVAMGERNWVIGRNNDLPWSKPRLPADLKHFADLTAGRPVLMGRPTWESIPEKYRPLDRGRSTIVISRSLPNDIPGTYVARSLEEGLEYAKTCPGSDQIFIAGGEQIYALAMPYIDRIYKTLVDEDPEGDTFFPPHPEISYVMESYIVPDFVPRLTFQTIVRSPHA